MLFIFSKPNKPSIDFESVFDAWLFGGVADASVTAAPF